MIGSLRRPGRIVIDGREMVLQRSASSPRIAIPCGAAGDVAAAVERLVQEVESPVAVKAVELRLLPPLLQIRRLTGFPRLRSAALRAAVGLQASGIFRQNGGSLVTAAVAVPTPENGSTVIAVAADEHFIDALLAALEVGGVTVNGIRPDEALGLPPLALDPPSTRRARAASLRRALRRWLVIATLSWLGFGLTASVRLHQRLAIAEQELAALRQPMEALHTARGRMTTAQAIIEALASATRERGRLSGLLLAVARGLPDSVVLTTLDLHMDGPGAMAGLAANPLAVVAALERLPGFNSPHLDGPPLRDPEDPAGWSSFSVGFGVVAR